MTTIEQSIDTQTAVQVDISEVLPSPVEALQNAVKALKKDYDLIQKKMLDANTWRAAIADLRRQIAEAAAAGDDAAIGPLSKDLQKANNALDKAIELSTDAELTLSDKKNAIKEALEAL